MTALQSLRERKSHMYNRIMDKLSTRAESDPTNDHSASMNAGECLSSSSEGESRNPTASQHDESSSSPTTDGKESGAASAASRAKDEDASSESCALRIADPASHPRALKILFLSSDTGGGHRASATSLAQQFQNLFPGSSYALCDIVQLDGPPPYNMLVKSYKHLSAHPQQWKLVYNVSNTRAYEMLADVHMKSTMERTVRKRIQSYDPDVVVSVHPLMTNVPVLACKNITKETGRNLPIFTVCTDLGSAHR